MIARFARLVLFAAGCLALAIPASALDRALSLEEEFLLQEISAHNTAIRTMAGRFQQIDTQGARTEGTFFIERPGKVRFRYGPPSREEIVSVGRGFYVIDREARTQYAYPQDQVPLRQFLQDELNLMTANLTDVVVSEQYAAVTLSDQSPVGTVNVSLIFDNATKDLVQWSLIEPSGAETTFSVYDVEKNVEIPAAYFYIDPTFRTVSE